jgi:hypothetical protein
LDDWFTATNLNSALARPGHNLPFVIGGSEVWNYDRLLNNDLPTKRLTAHAYAAWEA